MPGALVNGTGPTHLAPQAATASIRSTCWSGGLLVHRRHGCLRRTVVDARAAKWGAHGTPAVRRCCSSPVENTNAVGRVTFKINDSLTLFWQGDRRRMLAVPQDFLSQPDQRQLYLKHQPLFNLLYPGIGLQPGVQCADGTVPNHRGKPRSGHRIPLRCMPCGHGKSGNLGQDRRYLIGGEGTFKSWDYKFGFSGQQRYPLDARRRLLLQRQVRPAAAFRSAEPLPAGRSKPVRWVMAALAAASATAPVCTAANLHDQSGRL